jgi:hypothetical protein
MGGSDEEKFDHPTQKPVELMRRPILNHTKRGELVYEPFLGSGTTLAAAELTERVCVGIELDRSTLMSSCNAGKAWRANRPCSTAMDAPSMRSPENDGRKPRESRCP